MTDQQYKVYTGLTKLMFVYRILALLDVYYAVTSKEDKNSFTDLSHADMARDVLEEYKSILHKDSDYNVIMFVKRLLSYR